MSPNRPDWTPCVFLRWGARCLYGALSAIFFCVNMVCAALGERTSDGERGERTWNLVLVRVVVNDLLFILEAVLLASTLLLLTRHSRSASIHLISRVCSTLFPREKNRDMLILHSLLTSLHWSLHSTNDASAAQMCLDKLAVQERKSRGIYSKYVSISIKHEEVVLSQP